MDIRKIIKEEVDDFDWLKDMVTPKLKVGDIIDPLGGYFYWVSREAYLDGNRLLSYSDDNKFKGKVMDINPTEGWYLIGDIEVPEELRKRMAFMMSSMKSWENVYLSIKDVDESLQDTDTLHESEDFEWMDNHIRLEPNTMYYFLPPLSIPEMKEMGKKFEFETYSNNSLDVGIVDYLGRVMDSEPTNNNPDVIYLTTNENGVIAGWQNSLSESNYDPTIMTFDDIKGEVFGHMTMVDGRATLINNSLYESEEFDWIKDENPFSDVGYKDLIDATPDQYKRQWRFFNSQPVQSSRHHDLEWEIEEIREILTNGIQTVMPDEVYIEKIDIGFYVIEITLIQKAEGAWTVRDEIEINRVTDERRWGRSVDLVSRDMIEGENFNDDRLLESDDFEWIKNPDPNISSDWSKWPLGDDRYKVWIGDATGEEKGWFNDLLVGWGFEQLNSRGGLKPTEWLLIVPRHKKFYTRTNRLAFNTQPAKTLPPTYLWTYITISGIRWMNESDDIDWIQDEKPNIFSDPNNALYVDEPININELLKIIRDIYSSGNKVGDVYDDIDEYIKSATETGTLNIVRNWSTGKGFTISRAGDGIYSFSFAKFNPHDRTLHNYSQVYNKSMNESNDLEWIETNTPNWSSWYQYWGDKISEILPETLEEVEEFGSGRIMKVLFSLDVLLQGLRKHVSENEMTLDYGYMTHLYGLLTNIIKAIRKRDDGETEFNDRYSNEDVYGNGLKAVEQLVPVIVKYLEGYNL